MHTRRHTHAHTRVKANTYASKCFNTTTWQTAFGRESGRGSVSWLRANHGHLMQTNKQPKQSDNLQLSLADNNRSRYNNVRQSEGIWNSSAYQQNDAGSCENIHTYLHASPRLDSSRLVSPCLVLHAEFVAGVASEVSSAGVGAEGVACCSIVCQVGDFVYIVCSSNYVFSRQTARQAVRQPDRQANRRTTNKNSFAWNLLALCSRKQLRLTAAGTATTITTTTTSNHYNNNSTCSISHTFI